MLATLAQAVVNGLLIGGIYALVSIGVTLIFGVVKIVNFAQGEFVMIGMYISFFLATRYGIDPVLSLAVSMPVLFLIGVGLQHFLIRRVLGLGDMPQIFLTFALSLLLMNLALLLFTANYRTVQTPYSALCPGRKAHRLRARHGAQRSALGVSAHHGYGQGHARRRAKA
jgi:branched-chain amino acid transport system permease protein